MRAHLWSSAVILALCPLMARAGQADLVWRNTTNGDGPARPSLAGRSGEGALVARKRSTSACIAAS